MQIPAVNAQEIISGRSAVLVHNLRFRSRFHGRVFQFFVTQRSNGPSLGRVPRTRGQLISWTSGITHNGSIKTSLCPPLREFPGSLAKRCLTSRDAIPGRLRSSLVFPGLILLALTHVITHTMEGPVKGARHTVNEQPDFQPYFFSTSVTISITSSHLPQRWLSRFRMAISYPARSISSSPQRGQ